MNSFPTRPESSALPLKKEKISWLFAVSGRPTLKNHRSPSLVPTPVLSPGIVRAAVSVGLGAVARSLGVGWHPGAVGVDKTCFNSVKPKI